MGDPLDQPLSSLPQIGPQYRERLTSLGLKTIQDLLYYFPFRYDDLSQMATVGNFSVGDTVTLTGQIISLKNVYLRSGKTMQQGVFSDGSGTLPITWFNQPFLVKTLTQSPLVSLSGKVIRYRGHLTLSSPQYELFSLQSIHTGRLVPIYHETVGVSSKWLRRRLHNLFKTLPPLPDWLPPDLTLKSKLINLDTALREIHFPTSDQALVNALTRLKFDELFTFQLAAQIRKLAWAKKPASLHLKPYPQKLAQFINSLPFTLTSSQTKAIEEIVADLGKPVAMNRLLEGDVGSGKTVVAMAAMYLSFLNGLPSVLMAPTAVLARQHFQTISQLLTPYGLKIAFHSSAETVAVKKADVIIGTHALLYRPLPAKLGLVVIDEQHRFGVLQREKIIAHKTLPNILSMTATPIPRTIALTLYSELDISVLSQMPPGRLPVKTWLVPPGKRPAAYTWIKHQINHYKSQVFIVCPLITDSPSPLLDQVKAVETEYQMISQEIFPDFKVGLLHGRQNQFTKLKVIDQFTRGELAILVATPVIEVGVDIPNASIIIIEAAERFGLAQLHQLRGRVGRRQEQGYCLLFTTKGQTTLRLKALTTIHSGLKLAELDLKLRGQGDLLGTRQSGLFPFNLASLADLALIQATHQAATQIMLENPEFICQPATKLKLDSLLEKATEAI